jgi:hypothetical protein
MIWERDLRDLYREMRLRIIGETERFLARCLADPRLAPRIPRIQVGKGKFPPGLAEAFWAQVLADDTGPTKRRSSGYASP